MKQFKDPFEAAFEEQEESPPQSPVPPDDPDAPAAAPAAASGAARSREDENNDIELGELAPGGDPDKMAKMHSDGQGSNQSLSSQNIHQHHIQPSIFPSFSDSLGWINEFLQAYDKPPAPSAVESVHGRVQSPHKAQHANTSPHMRHSLQESLIPRSLEVPTSAQQVSTWRSGG